MAGCRHSENARSQPVLFYDDSKPESRAVLMLIDLLNVDVQKNYLELVEGEQLKCQKCPVQSVPTLFHEEIVLSDSHAILIYICENFSNGELCPIYHPKRLSIINKLFLNSSTLNRLYNETEILSITAQNVDLDFYMRRVEDAYMELDNILDENIFMAADQLTIADISIVASVGALDRMFPIDMQFPKLLKWFNFLRDMPAYKLTQKALDRQNETEQLNYIRSVWRSRPNAVRNSYASRPCNCSSKAETNKRTTVYSDEVPACNCSPEESQFVNSVKTPNKSRKQKCLSKTVENRTPRTSVQTLSNNGNCACPIHNMAKNSVQTPMNDNSVPKITRVTTYTFEIQKKSCGCSKETPNNNNNTNEARQLPTSNRIENSNSSVETRKKCCCIPNRSKTKKPNDETPKTKTKSSSRKEEERPCTSRNYVEAPNNNRGLPKRSVSYYGVPFTRSQSTTRNTAQYPNHIPINKRSYYAAGHSRESDTNLNATPYNDTYVPRQNVTRAPVETTCATNLPRKNVTRDSVETPCNSRRAAGQNGTSDDIRRAPPELNDTNAPRASYYSSGYIKEKK